MSTSKLPEGPLCQTSMFYTYISTNAVFHHAETCCRNQRHGSIIHTYNRNTASKDTHQITISQGCAFSSSTISQTQIGRINCKHMQAVKPYYFNILYLLSLIAAVKVFLFIIVLTTLMSTQVLLKNHW